MAEFIRKYGGNTIIGGVSAVPTALSASAPLDPIPTIAFPSPSQFLDSGLTQPTLSKLTNVKKEQLSESVEDLRSDFLEMSQNVRLDSQAMAKDAVRGTKDILSKQAFDLGQKAKEEAAALRRAAKQAMEEERSLKGLRGRATDEMRKLKERFTEHVQEAKGEILDDLQQMATGQLNTAKDKAGELFELGQDSLEREWKDLEARPERHP